MTSRHGFDEVQLYRIYESIYRNMQRENDLINQRLGWAIFLSAGLFAATTILVNITVNSRWEVLVIWPLYLVMAVLSFVGLKFSHAVRSAVKAAQDQHDRLRDHYRKYEDDFAAMGLPLPMGETSSHDRGKHTALKFPGYLVNVWRLAMTAEIAICAVFIAYLVTHFIGTRCWWTQSPPLLAWPALGACS